MASVAMFDEATANFKVKNSPPAPGHFVTYAGLPSDGYLRLTGEGTKLIRGELQNQINVPIKPWLDQASPILAHRKTYRRRRSEGEDRRRRSLVWYPRYRADKNDWIRGQRPLLSVVLGG